MVVIDLSDVTLASNNKERNCPQGHPVSDQYQNKHQNPVISTEETSDYNELTLVVDDNARKREAKKTMMNNLTRKNFINVEKKTEKMNPDSKQKLKMNKKKEETKEKGINEVIKKEIKQLTETLIDDRKQSQAIMIDFTAAINKLIESKEDKEEKKKEKEENK